MKTILVVREMDLFSRILTRNNFKIINLPLIETKVSDNLSGLEAKITDQHFDGIFITSRYAAQILADCLREKELNFAGKIYILGKRSFDILKDQHINLFFNQTANAAQEMLDSISLSELQNKHFLFVSGEKSLRIVPEFLENIAKVDEVIVYKTRNITVETSKVKSITAMFETNKIAAACFFSPSGVSSFIKQFGADILHQTIIAAIGKTTAEDFERRNLSVGFVSSKSNAEDFAVELIEYLKEDSPTKYTKGTKKRKTK